MVCFFIIAIICIKYIVGHRFFVGGRNYSFAREKNCQLIWVILVAILLQEGIGTLPFGSALLWYVSAIVVFYGGRALFEAENFIFIFLVSALLGVFALFLYS